MPSSLALEQQAAEMRRSASRLEQQYDENERNLRRLEEQLDNQNEALRKAQGYFENHSRRLLDLQEALNGFGNIATAVKIIDKIHSMEGILGSAAIIPALLANIKAIETAIEKCYQKRQDLQRRIDHCYNQARSLLYQSEQARVEEQQNGCNL